MLQPIRFLNWDNKGDLNPLKLIYSSICYKIQLKYHYIDAVRIIENCSIDCKDRSVMLLETLVEKILFTCQTYINQKRTLLSMGLFKCQSLSPTKGFFFKIKITPNR